MLPRFVVVPAVPVEMKTSRNGPRFFADTMPGGFYIYDNKEKRRLKLGLSDKDEAEDTCQKMNLETDIVWHH
ncbi:hypothetical protein WCE02_18530 [Pseudomonas juntendi]|uniref:hypothetical protein n=1 Tax=Pseudomonas juntendi TaxID=2666183 RepID=UPI0034D54CB5